MNPKILIVDDEPYILLLLEQTLEELEDEGVEILRAEDGAQALEIIAAEHPNLIFLDVMMPSMDGFTVCEKVKHDLHYDDTTVILLTAKGQEYDRQRGAEVGADLYMTKPFDPDVVLEKAQEILGL